MALATGVRLGPYEIVSSIGAGGMGEVYKARDMRLGRTVAIKILPADAAADPGRRRRFEQEARAVSALNHPHICVLYDIGEAEVGDGSSSEAERSSRPPRPVRVSYLVMEYLDGQALAARLAKGPLPLPQALEYATQIADALAAAHKSGTLHRDLKPGNVMLTKTGAKLLDFGLAKLKAPADVTALTTAAAPSEPATAQGVVLGTVPYMAPEQLEGKATDARTDLFAFGAMLYEMVTARRAFQGASAASVIAAILDSDPPPISSLQPLTPPALDRLVRRCLAKSPDDRWDTAHDVGDELRWIRETSGSVAAVAPARTGARWRRVAGLASAAMVLVAASATLTWMLARPAQPPRPAVQRFLIDTRPADGLRGPNRIEAARGRNRPSRTAIALSPDGTCLVFSAIHGEHQQLYLRRLNEVAALPLDGTEGADSPFFSPDGAWIGFWARNSLWKMRLDGGAPIELCSSTQITGASWGSRDVIAFATSQGGEIRAVPAGGGSPKAVSTVDVAHGEIFHALPRFLPDGGTVLFTAVRDWLDPRSASISAVSLASGTRTALVDGAMDARYVPTGHLIYFRLGRLEAAPFDPVRVVVTGEAVGLIPDVMQALNAVALNVATGAAQVTIAASGTLVYVAGGILPDQRSELVWVDRRGTIVETLSIQPGPNYMPRLSPDGKRILFSKISVNGSLWCYDLARQTSTMIPTTEAQPSNPVWLPDGDRAVFAAPPGGYTRLHWVKVDGSAPSAPVGGEVPARASEYPGSWTPDGKSLLFTRETREPPDARLAIWQLRVDGGQPQRSALVEPPAATASGRNAATALVTQPAVSPDGRWLAYASTQSGRSEVYVQRLPDLVGRQQLSRDGGLAPLWRRDNRELFYVTEGPKRKMMAIDVRPGADFAEGVPRVLFELSDDLYTSIGQTAPFDVSLDGQRFLFVRLITEPVPPPPSQMHVVLNWFEELKAKVPSK